MKFNITLIFSLLLVTISNAQLWDPHPTSLSGYLDFQSKGASPQYIIRNIELNQYHTTFLSTVSTNVDSGLKIGYAFKNTDAEWISEYVIGPPITGTPAIEIWHEKTIITFNRLIGDTIIPSIYIHGEGEKQLPRIGVIDEPQNMRTVITADGKLFIVGERKLAGSVHKIIVDTNLTGNWSEPLQSIRSGNQYVVASNKAGRVGIVWSNPDTIGFIESFDNGVSFNPPIIVFATHIINGDFIRPGKGLDAVYLGNALYIVWSAFGSTPRSARILSWNPIGGMQVVFDSSIAHYDTLASSMHPLDDHLVIDRPTIGIYEGSASVGIAFVVFKESCVDNDGWHYGDIYVTEGGLYNTGYCYNITNSPNIDERYPEVTPHNPPIFGLFMVAFQKDSIAGRNSIRNKTSLAEQYVKLAGVIDLSVDETSNLPKDPALYQNYPNPFNPRTTIRYTLTKQSHVRLTVYDILGREVAVLVNGYQSPGTREIHWDSDGLPSGLYFYRINTPDFVQIKKMLLLR